MPPISSVHIGVSAQPPGALGLIPSVSPIHLSSHCLSVFHPIQATSSCPTDVSHELNFCALVHTVHLTWKEVPSVHSDFSPPLPTPHLPVVSPFPAFFPSHQVCPLPAGALCVYFIFPPWALIIFCIIL